MLYAVSSCDFIMQRIYKVCYAERVSDLIARLSEAEGEAKLAQLALAEQDDDNGLGKGSAVLSATLYNLRSTLHSVAVRLSDQHILRISGYVLWRMSRSLREEQ